ncbi:MAG: outer membrane beta-barrel protein [Bacteroidetes bacterium]|nr:outer membrane beta-barrel protein [Bacteroidota bacterium]
MNCCGFIDAACTGISAKQKLSWYQRRTYYSIFPSVFKSYWTSSFNLGINFEKPVADIFSVGAEMNYASFALDKNAADLTPGYTGGSFNAVQLLATGKICEYNSVNSVSPYGRVGLGISLTSFDDIRNPNGSVVLRGSSENGLGVMMAGGVAFNLQSGSKVTLEASYRVNNRPGDSYNGILFDVGYLFGL